MKDVVINRLFVVTELYYVFLQKKKKEDKGMAMGVVTFPVLFNRSGFLVTKLVSILLVR